MPGLAGPFSHSTAEEAVSLAEMEEKQKEGEGPPYTVNTPDCSAALPGWKGDNVGRLSFHKHSRDFAGCFQCCTFLQNKEVKHA